MQDSLEPSDTFPPTDIASESDSDLLSLNSSSKFPSSSDWFGRSSGGSGEALKCMKKKKVRECQNVKLQ